jgi:hypothetical protein
MKKKQHAHRSFDEAGNAICECGKKFDDDEAWRGHYESETTEKERASAENRPFRRIPKEEEA